MRHRTLLHFIHCFVPHPFLHPDLVARGPLRVVNPPRVYFSFPVNLNATSAAIQSCQAMNLHSSPCAKFNLLFLFSAIATKVHAGMHATVAFATGIVGDHPGFCGFLRVSSVRVSYITNRAVPPSAEGLFFFAFFITCLTIRPTVRVASKYQLCDVSRKFANGNPLLRMPGCR